MRSIEDEIPAFKATVAKLLSLFDTVPELLVDKRPRPGDWSVKEIACHLVDSASNNHQRFTHLQRTERLVFPTYEPEPWVALEKPAGLAWMHLIGLVENYNAFILHLVRNLDKACLGHVWVDGGQDKTLEFLVRDYYRHLEWHIAHLENRLREIARR